MSVAGLRRLVTKDRVKAALPLGGALAFALGEFLGAWLVSRARAEPGVWALFLGGLAGAGALGFAGTMAAEALIGPACGHVDTLLTAAWMFGALAAASLLQVLLGRFLYLELAGAVQFAAVWAAGFASIRREEPGFVSWRTDFESLRGPRRG